MKKKTYTIFTYCQGLAGLEKTTFTNCNKRTVKLLFTTCRRRKKKDLYRVNKAFIHIFHVYIILGWSVLVRVPSESGRINHSLVKEFIAFGAWTHLKLLCGRISCEEIGIDNIDVTNSMKSVCQFVKKILTNDIFFNFCSPWTLRVKPSTLQHTLT